MGIGLLGVVDLLGGLLITAALMLGVCAIVGPAARLGWGAPRTLIAAALAAALLAAFVLRQATARTPLLNLRLLRVPNVAAAQRDTAAVGRRHVGLFFLGALYLQRILGYDALQIGLAFLPVTVFLAISSMAGSERMTARYGARTPVVLGLAVMAGGLAPFARARRPREFPCRRPSRHGPVGSRRGALLPALMGVAMSGVTSADSGVTSGLMGTTAQIGGALGLAVLATLSMSRTVALRESGVPTARLRVSGGRSRAGSQCVWEGQSLAARSGMRTRTRPPAPASTRSWAAAICVSGKTARTRTDSAPAAAATVRSCAAFCLAWNEKSSLPSRRTVMLANSSGENGKYSVCPAEIRGDHGMVGHDGRVEFAVVRQGHLDDAVDTGRGMLANRRGGIAITKDHSVRHGGLVDAQDPLRAGPCRSRSRRPRWRVAPPATRRHREPLAPAPPCRSPARH